MGSECFQIVEPILGEPTRFYVISRRAGVEPYLVDLDEYGGNGWCACEHFEFRLQPIVTRGLNEEPLRCWHIEQALRWREQNG